MHQPEPRRVLRAHPDRVLPALRDDDGGPASGGAPRTTPIPTRLVEGFLPGDRVGNVETVRNRSAHAWVEVYFPTVGWVPFESRDGPWGGLSQVAR